MRNVEIDINKKDDYIDWLENICLSFLTNNGKIVSKESMLKKIKHRGIDTENYFVTYLLKAQSYKQEEEKIIQALPLLKSYPIDLNDDIYCDEEFDLVYEWELKIVNNLLSKLQEQYRKKQKDITPEKYSAFFLKEIAPYRKYFLNCIEDGQIYKKILPENMSLYWSYRISENIPWDESWKEQKNIGISISTVLEGDYLYRDKEMEDFRYAVGDFKGGM